MNVTLIFSVEVYAQVVEAYLKGLEKRMAKGGAVDRVASVASFFVSRIDTAVDKKLEEIAKAGRAEAAELMGKAAIANAKLAYAEVPAALQRSALGEAGRRRRPGAASAVGFDRHQESEVLRCALHRHADWAAHGKHHASGHL